MEDVFLVQRARDYQLGLQLLITMRLTKGAISAMPTEYTARILKLDLPEQDTLKNDAERCSADPGMLQAIGRGVGRQIRITRPDYPGFVAPYTVAHRPIHRPTPAGRTSCAPAPSFLKGRFDFVSITDQWRSS